jgi:hypothetical protein
MLGALVASAAPVRAEVTREVHQAGEALPDADAMYNQLRQLFPGGVFRGTPGDWATFRLGPPPYHYIRVAVTGVEDRPEGRAYWTELGMGETPDSHMLGIKMLTVGDPMAGTRVLKAYYRMALGKTVEVSTDKMTRHPPAAAPVMSSDALAPAAGQATVEKKMVPAGSFDTVKVKADNFTYWLSADARVFHLVRLDMGSLWMELFDMGQGATDTLGLPPPAPEATRPDGGR